jgi:tetratricopeptide (TPR) repeat protein
MGRVLIEAERFGLAANLFQRCMDLSQRWEPAVNRALALLKMGKPAAAEPILRKVLKEQPQATSVLNNLALLCVNECRVAEALEYAEQSLALDPSDKNDAHSSKGYASLMLGKWADGWRGFETMVGTGPRKFTAPEAYWQGEKGGLLYVQGEQGLGDELSFASILPDAAKDNDIVFDCDPRLEGLFKRSFPSLEIHGTRFTPERPWLNDRTFDYACMVGSLAKYYRNSAESFPGTPHLVADPERRIQWKALLDQLPGRKVGIAWTGGKKSTFSDRRSFALEELLPILKTPGISWISLQYKDPTQETIALEKAHGIKIHHWKRACETQDYDDTAALVAELDCIVSVPTAVCHLAGGLGKRALVLTPARPNWFWQLSGDRLPWHDGIELYRQTDDWPFEAVIKAL